MNKDKNKISWHKVFKTEWFSIEATSNKFLNNKPYYRLSCSNSAEILAITTDRKIILVRQFRPPVGIETLEFPAGYLDPKESKEETIKRELKEETGFICDSIISLGSFLVSPSRINNIHYIFFGKDARSLSIKNKKEKGSKVVLVTPAEFEKLIIKGKILVQSSIGIYLLAKLRGFL